VSFIGSIPLGYLNIVGLKFTTALDSKSAFISIRIVIIEAFVVYFFAFLLINSSRIKLMKAIDVFLNRLLLFFGIFFLFSC
jgi:hypothetical protein